MSQLFEAFKENPFDTYIEHKFHDTYQKNCSECYKVNRLIKSRNIVNRERNYNKYAHEEAFGRNGQIDDPNFTRNPLER